jgi:Transcriptional regulator PadR-like family
MRSLAPPRRRAAPPALLHVLPGDGSEFSDKDILARASGQWLSRMYTVLYELQREGLVSMREESWTPQPQPRLFYHLTEAGRLARQALNKDRNYVVS